MGLTQGSIFNYEHGFRDIPVVNLIAILDHFDISLAEFMAGVPQVRVLDDSADIGIAKRLIADGRADRPGREVRAEAEAEAEAVTTVAN